MKANYVLPYPIPDKEFGGAEFFGKPSFPRLAMLSRILFDIIFLTGVEAWKLEVVRGFPIMP